MKKLICIIALCSLLFSLCSCDGHFSSYKAIGLVRSNTAHSCNTSFLSLDGRLVFKLKKTDSSDEGQISYSVSVDSGELHLYYDIYGTEEELVNVKAGESVSGKGGYIEGKKTVYIIIEAVSGTRGKVSVELNGED